MKRPKASFGCICKAKEAPVGLSQRRAVLTQAYHYCSVFVSLKERQVFTKSQFKVKTLRSNALQTDSDFDSESDQD